ncbi:hypothetical protein LTR53_001798 [Teratosphaeriaceae sp. CCFEE 6253]|nr:hypothetical protein LTR53_001798 [Teratosphaeriaceae sp. CCFEE 6253]
MPTPRPRPPQYHPSKIGIEGPAARDTGQTTQASVEALKVTADDSHTQADETALPPAQEVEELAEPGVPPPPDHDGATWHCFNANDDVHRYARLRCSNTLAAFNAQPVSVTKQERAKAWQNLTKPPTHYGAAVPEAPMVKSPLYIDYGTNIRIASTALLHRNVYLGDSPITSAPIIVGEGAIIGPNVQILTIIHDVDWRHRTGFYGPCSARGVVIGRDASIGSGAIILPGCTIGDGAVIGAGAVVSRSMPAFHVAVGNPAAPMWKVAADVPDAPGLYYDAKGGRMFVRRATGNIYTGTQPAAASTGPKGDASEHGPGLWSAASTPPHSPDPAGANPDAVQEPARQMHGARHPTKQEVERMIGVDIALLILAALVGWAVLHFALYWFFAGGLSSGIGWAVLDKRQAVVGSQVRAFLIRQRPQVTSSTPSSTSISCTTSAFFPLSVVNPMAASASF